jgi:hypothetical protein
MRFRKARGLRREGGRGRNGIGGPDRRARPGSPEKVMVTDGPFAESKELLGGYAVLPVGSK